MVAQEQERTGLNPSNVHETLSLNGEVVFSKELTVRELLCLGENGNVEEGLLEDVPFFFEVRDLGDSFLNIASFSGEQPLVDSKNLLSLLNAAKSGGSSRKGQDRLGITGDWDIILPQIRARYPRKKELYDHHKENVPHFSEFEENHFKKFWDLITNLSAQDVERNEDFFFEKQADRFISEEGLSSEYEPEWNEYNLISLTGLYEYRALTIEFLKNKGHDLGNLINDRCYGALRSLFSGFNNLRREELVIEWYDYLVSYKGKRQIAIDASKVIFYPYRGDKLIVVNKNGNFDYTRMAYYGSSSEYELSKSVLDGADSIEKLGDGQVKVTKGESHIVIDFVADGKGIRRPVIKEKQYGPYSPNQAAFLAPLIIWKRDKNTNQASYFCGQVPQELIGSHPHLFSERHDTLLGQLAVAAYSPKARDQMPTEITMEGTDGLEATQRMFEAQSVLLVPMHDKVFLEQSPIILGLEKLKDFK